MQVAHFKMADNTMTVPVSRVQGKISAHRILLPVRHPASVMIIHIKVRDKHLALTTPSAPTPFRETVTTIVHSSSCHSFNPVPCLKHQEWQTVHSAHAHRILLFIHRHQGIAVILEETLIHHRFVLFNYFYLCLFLWGFLYNYTSPTPPPPFFKAQAAFIALNYHRRDVASLCIQYIIRTELK